MKAQCPTIRLAAALAAILTVSTLGTGRAAAQFVVTEIVDSTGDGAGNGLDRPLGIALDAAGNAYVTGQVSDNVFKLTPGGAITVIVDANGDGAGNFLDGPFGITVDTAGNVYVTGDSSHNAFTIALDCNNNAVPDATDIAAGTSKDCNANGIPDECDIAAGTSLDGDSDGVPDECDNCPTTANAD